MANPRRTTSSRQGANLARFQRTLKSLGANDFSFSRVPGRSDVVTATAIGRDGSRQSFRMDAATANAANASRKGGKIRASGTSVDK